MTVLTQNDAFWQIFGSRSLKPVQNKTWLLNMHTIKAVESDNSLSTQLRVANVMLRQFLNSFVTVRVCAAVWTTYHSSNRVISTNRRKAKSKQCLIETNVTCD